MAEYKCSIRNKCSVETQFQILRGLCVGFGCKGIMENADCELASI